MVWPGLSRRRHRFRSNWKSHALSAEARTPNSNHEFTETKSCGATEHQEGGRGSQTEANAKAPSQGDQDCAGEAGRKSAQAKVGTLARRVNCLRLAVST